MTAYCLRTWTSTSVHVSRWGGHWIAAVMDRYKGRVSARKDDLLRVSVCLVTCFAMMLVFFTCAVLALAAYPAVAHPPTWSPPHWNTQEPPQGPPCGPSRGSQASKGKVCVVEPAGSADSAPALAQALNSCGRNPPGSYGTVILKNETYNIKSVLNTTGLSNLAIEHHGTLLWDTNIPYWLNHSLPVGYQNQSSAWLFGGENISWNGFGYGTLDGNGQVWYDFINGTNNYPGRPHQITYTGLKDSLIQGVRYVQSQMWTMTLIESKNVVLEDIYVNSTDTEHAVGFDFSSLNVRRIPHLYLLMPSNH
jgi:hypothetical protein